MTDDGVVAIARRYFEAINRHDLDALRAALAPTFLHHSGAGELDPDTFIGQAGKYFAAFPDLRYDLDEILPLADGHGVVARWTIRGTHLGLAFGAAPTGKPFASAGLSLHRFEDGLVIEDWEYNDDLSMLEAIGFSLEPPSA